MKNFPPSRIKSVTLEYFDAEMGAYVEGPTLKRDGRMVSVSNSEYPNQNPPIAPEVVDLTSEFMDRMTG